MPSSDGPRARAAIVALVVAAIGSGLALLIVAAQGWLLIFAGLLFAVLLSAAADAGVRWLGLSRGLALGLVLLTVVLVIGAAGLALWPSVAEQIDQLAKELPAAVRDLQAGRRSRVG